MNIRMKKIVIAGALIAAASAVAAQAADQGTTPADQRITTEVERKLSADPHLSGTIGVTTNAGVVTLVGLVATSGEADRAERDAQSVAGVKEVDNGVNATVGKNF